MLNDGRGTDAPSSPSGGLLWPLARNLLVLTAVGAMAAWALTFRSEVSQALREAVPNLPAADAPASAEARGTAEEAGDGLAALEREVVFRKAAGGHFLIDAVVNGVSIRFLVDTGASHVVLSPEDARRLHLNGSMLRYSLRYETANGVVRAAPVTLRDVRIGQLELYDVEASVNEAPMGISLLGMSFLERLEGYAVEGNRLILRW